MTQINFSPGPAMLPDGVRARIGQDWMNGLNNRVTVAEISHRSCGYIDLVEACEIRLRRLLRLPDSHHVLFMQGGANMQFVQVPMNFGAGRYVLTGHWGEKALQQAKLQDSGCQAWVQADAQGHFDDDVDGPDLTVCNYTHLTSNETIHGIQLHTLPRFIDPCAHPLVADMSSDIASRVVDYRDYGLVYAGTQKNLGIAGLTLVLVRDDFLQQARDDLPVMLGYKQFANKESMFNTPPTFAWYVTGLVLEWLEQQGGIVELERRNLSKAECLYQCIDQSDFYTNQVLPERRSHMNVVFNCPSAELSAEFVTQSESAGMQGLKGHRALGGLRASLYNSMPLSSVQTLVEFMQEFERRYG